MRRPLQLVEFIAGSKQNRTHFCTAMCCVTTATSFRATDVRNTAACVVCPSDGFYLLPYKCGRQDRSNFRCSSTPRSACRRYKYALRNLVVGSVGTLMRSTRRRYPVRAGNDRHEPQGLDVMGVWFWRYGQLYEEMHGSVRFSSVQFTSQEDLCSQIFTARHSQTCYDKWSPYSHCTKQFRWYLVSGKWRRHYCLFLC